MATETQAGQLAQFVERARFEDLSAHAREQLKLRIFDSLACAIGALEGEPVRTIREQLDDFGGEGRCTLIGGGTTAPDRAAFHNGALVRYLDFNDSYLARGETCHPSDNLGAVLAAAEYAGRSGRDLLAALVVAYQVQCRLSDEAPVRHKGFDHTTQGAYAVAAGVSKALGLDRTQTANAIAICGTAFNALRVTRTGALSHWKGLAYPNLVFCATHATFLAMRGITGPPQVFEGNKGFMDAIAGHFQIDWSRENLERVGRTIVKKFNAEIHSQSCVEGAVELKHQHGFRASSIRWLDLEVFDVAYNIIGGGEEGDKVEVHSKEQADHSLPYMVAVALLDDGLMPEQYLPERIRREDVQALLRKVRIRPSTAYSDRFPDEMPCRVRIELDDGSTFETEKRDYEGFHTRPAGWETLWRKFEPLAGPFTSDSSRRRIRDAVAGIDEIQVKDLTRLLAEIRAPVSLGKGVQNDGR